MARPLPSAMKMQFDVDAAFDEAKTMARTLEQAIGKLRYLRRSRKAIWLGKVNKLLEDQPPVTKIGFYGVTGAGKSSVINALLDGNIVPASSYGAGTTTVTEVHYQQQDNVTAEVSFISEENWKATISAILDAVEQTSPGDLEEVFVRAKNDALAVAWSQVRDVYPKLGLDQLSGKTPDDIISSDPEVKKVLGTTRTIIAKDAQSFAGDITVLIGSKRNARPTQAYKFRRPKEAVTTRGIKTDAVLWPIIDRVKIYSNAAVLSSGVVLVDLPGISDINVARGKIAIENIDYCDKIWILAPIVRAVNDKIAKDLLSESFKRQMEMDGSYNPTTLSFIATKTDDISCDDIIRQLDLGGDPELQKIEGIIEECVEELDVEQKIQPSIKEEMEDAEEQLTVLAQKFGHHIQDDFRKASAETSSKRPRTGTFPKQASKRARFDAGSAFTVKSEEHDIEMPEVRLEAETAQYELERKLEKLQARHLKVERTLLACRMNKIEADKRKKAFCSLARSKDACLSLRNDFRQGLIDVRRDKEYHSESVLPVFCTSAVEYGKLKGYTKNDGEATCFADRSETGILALKSWCSVLAMPSKEDSTRRVFGTLESLSQSIQSYVDGASQHDNVDRANLKLRWCEDSALAGSGIKQRLTEEFSKLVNATVEDFRTKWAKPLRSVCKRAASQAREQALETCEELLDFQTVNHQTVRAIIKHYGAFKNHQDLNEALAQPILDELLPVWVEIFDTNFFEKLEFSIYAVAVRLLDEIKESTAGSLHKQLGKISSGCVRDVSLAVRREIKVACQRIDKEQRALSRSIASHIRDHLRQAYQRASDLQVAGYGATVERKATFIKHVERSSGKIFDSAGKMVTNEIFGIMQSAAVGIHAALETVAHEVEVNISTLWEDVRDDVSEMKARSEVMKSAIQVQEQVMLWQDRMNEAFSNGTGKPCATSFP